MEHQGPSRTAYAVARYRAGHQVLDGGAIFKDPYACAILGDSPQKIAADLAEEPGNASRRSYMATRSRIGEEWLHAAYARGTRQAVVLGAGLDTFSLRNPYDDLKIFEVDHPATQAWKRERLAAANLTIPATLTFVPVDFTADDLETKLRAAGYDPAAPGFFLWLGVVPYLREEAVYRTLASIARMHGEVAFDYSEPIENFPAEVRAHIAAMAEKVAALGEPWLSFFDPARLAARLREMGFSEIEDLDRNAAAARVESTTPTSANAVGPHLLRARC